MRDTGETNTVVLMSRKQPLIAQDKQKTVQSLFALTEFDPGITMQELLHVMAKAPDPETACRAITACIRSESGVLRQKWRELIERTWQECNLGNSQALELPVTSMEVESTGILQDIHAFLEEIEKRPCNIEKDKDGITVSTKDAKRLFRAIPSIGHEDAIAPEHEQNCTPLLRLRLVAQGLRLVRVYNGKLQIVQSRYKRFCSLPSTHQYYAIWHTDAYHIDWTKISGMWKQYIEVVQNYLPLLWDVIEGSDYADEFEEASASKWAENIVEVFFPLWEEEGLFEKNPNKIMKIYQQMMLPHVIGQLVVKDLLLRYGCIQQEAGPLELLGDRRGAITMSRTIELTNLGKTLIKCEKEEDLPCGVELLD